VSRAPTGPAVCQACAMAPDEVAGLGTLAEVIRWALGSQPPREIVAVVAQDEYTNDVVLPWRDGSYLVFDTT
jgi:hypothetical protein